MKISQIKLKAFLKSPRFVISAAAVLILLLVIVFFLIPRYFPVWDFSRFSSYSYSYRDDDTPPGDKTTISFSMQDGGFAGYIPEYPHIFDVLTDIKENRISEKNDNLLREAFAAEGIELLPEDKITAFSTSRDGSNIMDGMNTASVTVKPVNMTDGGWLSPDGTVFYKYTGFADSSSYTIPRGVTEIGDRAFMYSDVSEVIIPDGVTEIGEKAFKWCPNLNSVVIPYGVTEIGDSAFEMCSNLANLTIPDSVIKIGDRAFMNCEKLTNLTVPDSVTEIGRYAFNGTNLSELSATETNATTAIYTD